MSFQAKDRARYQRSQWMEKYESECIRLCPNVRGKIDWNTAQHYYCQGTDPKTAAASWVSRKEVSPA